MSPWRVTALVAGLGAGVGFVLGTVMLASLQVFAPGGFHWSIDIPFGMMFGGTFGALVGGVGAPALSWLFLRRVPLGRAILWSTVSTIVGAGAGILLGGHAAIGGCVGFILGALVLRATHRGRTPNATL
jgi:hypothetical protein